MPSESEIAAKKLRLALDLFDGGVELKLASLRRECPNASEAELRAKLQTWLLERPGAPFGDVAGTVRVRE
jgi:hypothetical protein